MTVTATQPDQFYAGDLLLITILCTDGNGNNTDPSTLTVKYEDQGLVTGVTTILLSALHRVDTGIYTLGIDTTGFVADIWTLQAVATGSVLAADVVQWQILALPFT